MPAMWVMQKFSTKGHFALASVIGFIQSFTIHLIHLGWVLWIFGYFYDSAGTNLFPYIFYGYSVATAPFTYMAQHEDEDAIGTWIGLWLIQISYILLGIFNYLDELGLYLFVIITLTILADIFLSYFVYRIQKDTPTSSYEESLQA
jgi:hypothetical protein